MTNFGKMRRKREPKGSKNQIVFEIRPVGDAQPDAMVPSRELPELEAFNSLVAYPLDRDAETSRSMNTRK